MVGDLLRLRVGSKSLTEVVYIRSLEVLDDIVGMRQEVIESGE